MRPDSTRELPSTLPDMSKCRRMLDLPPLRDHHLAEWLLPKLLLGIFTEGPFHYSLSLPFSSSSTVKVEEYFSQVVTLGPRFPEDSCGTGSGLARHLIMGIL